MIHDWQETWVNNNDKLRSKLRANLENHLNGELRQDKLDEEKKWLLSSLTPKRYKDRVGRKLVGLDDQFN